MFGVALLTSTLLALTESRIYDSCELARDFLKLGVSKEHIATWVCIAYHESRFDTTARNPNSGDHGLLQISELYWCGPGKACGVSCSAFRDDDISDDVECALKIHEEHTRLQGDGFLAWVVYPYHCKHNAKKYLANCDVFLKDTSYKLEERGRFLKSQNHGRMEPTPFFKKYTNIDELQPPNIPINTLLRGFYDDNKANTTFTNIIKEKNTRNFITQSQNINKNQEFDWVNTISTLFNKDISNVKITNIDALMPPIFGTGVSTMPLTTTTVRSTTIDPALIGIKPPNPRKIESNQFRRQMMSLKNNYIENSSVKHYNFTKLKLPAAARDTSNVTTLPKSNHHPKEEVNVVSSFKIVHTDNKKEINYNNQLTPITPFTRLLINRTLSTIYVTPKEMVVSTTTGSKLQVNNHIKTISTNIATNNKTSFRHTDLVKPTATTVKYKSTPMPATTESNRRRFYFTPPQVETSTQYPRTLTPWMTRSSQTDSSTLGPKISSPKPKSTTLSSTSISVTERTLGTTQSIFDFYLNPTKRPNIIFQFPEFPESPYKVRIFSGGTTTLTPSFLNSRHP
ncbi:uncharacterized protein LOC123718803 [Pieris brassicae]|uniref:uncharacterized protein LOC123718803 n=1 Tax=Pieris brassicae TaxID=7116 RepID=UPI001E661B91|nr:uncharacterized protein LOC123718803 [Pieris brassicae]